ncbi:MAG: nascent polypeptide-associated complex protein [Nitrososphaerota archaeon]
MKRVSPRQLRRLQAKMLGSLGLDVKELGRASKIIIELEDKIITIQDANVLEMKLENESVFQIIGGEISEEGRVEERYEPSSEDVILVAAQAGVSEEEARSALIEANGDLAKAILLLKSRRH